MPSTATVVLFGDEVKSDKPPSLPSADMSAPSLAQLVARQSESTPADDSDTGDTGGSRNMSTYYFVFFALLICIAVLCTYFVWRRRRNALMVRPGFHGQGYHRDVREWDTLRHRRRYWNTNFRNEQPSREEGLNEDGEAPPPYMPKNDEESGNVAPHSNEQHRPGNTTPWPGEPSIPMNTLSRDQAGLGKPPGYEQNAQPVGNEASGSRLP